MAKEYDIEFYRKFRKFVIKFMKFMYRIEVTGLENIPKEGNYLLVGNHLHILDSWLLCALLDEDLRFMVDKKLYRYKSWEDFFTSVGTFPIDPEIQDIKSIKTAVKLLRDNEKVVIFPEGKTHKITKSVPFKAGIPRLAIMGNSPIIPFGINGKYIPTSKLKINFGESIDFKDLDIPKNEQDEYLESTVRKLERK